MSGPPPAVRLHVRRPADFLALIPYLLGFHPRESLVAVLSAGGRVLLSARIDLPPPSVTDEVATRLRELVTRHGAEELVLVVYTDDAGLGRSMLGRLVQMLGPAPRDALLVSGQLWWSLTCERPCCPAEGSPYDPAGHPLAAEAVYAGLSAEADRSVLQRQVAGPGTAENRRLTGLVAATLRRTADLSRPEAAALMADTVDRCLARPDAPDDPEAVLLAVLTEDLVVRDVAWAMMSRDRAPDHLRIWGRVVARSPEAKASGPLALLGVAAWIAGNGALQNCCVERLEETDPGYSLGLLLADISDRALPPSVWDTMADDLRQEVRAVAGLERLH